MERELRRAPGVGGRGFGDLSCGYSTHTGFQIPPGLERFIPGQPELREPQYSGKTLLCGRGQGSEGRGLVSDGVLLQVTIEVDPSSQTEVELDLSDTRTDWGDPELRSQHELFWPLFWEYSDVSDAEISTGDGRIENAGDYSSQYDWEDNVLSGGEDGRSSPGDNWITDDKYLYGDDHSPGI